MVSRRGFTLLEVLIVATIIVILSLALMNGATTMMINQRLSNSTDRVVSTLNLARNLAITHNSIYTVRLQNYLPPQPPVPPSTVVGAPDLSQVISVYCYPRANDALALVEQDRLTGQPKTTNPNLNWGFHGTLEGTSSNYLVSHEVLAPGTWFGIQQPFAATAPDDHIIYFLPDGTASETAMLFVTNDIQLRDDPTDTLYVWKDRNELRRYVYNKVLGAYSPPAAPETDPTAKSVQGLVRLPSGVKFIQLFQGGMIRNITEPQP